MEIVELFNNTYYDLTRKFMELCREHPTTPVKDIPEAMDMLKEINEYEVFVKKYFGYVYNINKYCFEKEK